MTRSVADGAIILTAIAGRDPRDNFTLAQPPVVPDFTKALNADGLQGVRLGVPRKLFAGTNADVVAGFPNELWPNEDWPKADVVCGAPNADFGCPKADVVAPCAGWPNAEVVAPDAGWPNADADPVAAG